MIVAATDGLTVSVSQLKEFMICPRRYQLHRVLGVEPAFVPVPLALGSATHTGIAAMYSSLQLRGELSAFNEVAQVFRDAWSVAAEGPVPLKLEDDDPDPVDTGVRMLEAFHRHVASAGAVSVVAVELPFAGVGLYDPDSGEMLDEQLSGVIDLVVSEGQHNVIVEHKTAARKWSRDQLDYDLQITAYQTAGRAAGLGAEVGLRLQVVTKTKVAVRSRSRISSATSWRRLTSCEPRQASCALSGQVRFGRFGHGHASRVPTRMHVVESANRRGLGRIGVVMAVLAQSEDREKAVLSRLLFCLS